MFIPTDLHGHTFFSDGRASPEEFVDFRREMQLSVIAISDHDVMAGVRRGAAAAAKARLVLIPALEVTSFLHFGTDRAEQFHILAYYPPDFLVGPRLEQTAFYKRGLLVQSRWRDFALAWLSQQTSEDQQAIDGGDDLAAKTPADFPALQSMIDRIVARRRPLYEAFRDHHVRFWQDDRELFGWEPEEAMDAIRADGAIDIVAHPVRYRDKERTIRILERATGLEVYTSRHKAEVAAHFRSYAEAQNKLWTASSDDHQNARYARPPCGTPHATLERIFQRPLPLHLVYAA